MSKEYTYDIDKYTIGVDENGEDGIGMTVAKIENGEINFLGNCYGENARCIDLLIKENKQLNGAIQTYDILLKSNIEENKRLKEEVKAVNKGLRKVQQRSIKYKNRCLKLNKKIYELKEQLEDMTLCRDIASGHRKEVQDRESILLNQQKEFIKYLELEKDYFVRGCSNIYEDSLGKTRLVNEDIFDEIDNILQKYREIIGGK